MYTKTYNKVEIMYIYERLFGVILYAYMLVLMSVIIAKSKRIYLGKILFIYTIILSIMAYFYVPGTSADLYRVFAIMNNWKFIDISEFIELAFRTTTPFANIYIYLISIIGNNHLLPAVTAFIYYSNVFYILKKYSHKYNISAYTTSVVLFFIMSSISFIGVISGIRNQLAFSIIAVCIYRDTIENKLIIKNLPFYIIASLMHNAAFALVLIRFAFLTYQKSNLKYKKALFILINVIVVFLLFRYGITYWQAMIDKSYNYLSGESYRDLWGYIIGALLVLTITFIHINVKKTIHNKKNNMGQVNMYYFSRVLLIICVIFSFEYNIFARFSLFTLIISIPWILEYCDSSLSNDKLSVNKYSNIRIKLIFISIVILGVASTRGSLSALKFFIF